MRFPSSPGPSPGGRREGMRASSGTPSEVERHAEGEEATAGGVGGATAVREFRRTLGVFVGAATHEAAEVGVEREVAREAELETDAGLHAEIGVVGLALVGTAVVDDAGARPTEPDGEVELHDL